jgi:hypothetical protein
MELMQVKWIHCYNIKKINYVIKFSNKFNRLGQQLNVVQTELKEYVTLL